MLNSGFRGKRATDGTGAISAQIQSVQATDPVPKITGWAVTDSSYVAFDDTAATSGSIIVVYGNNFVSGMTVYINNSLVSATYLDSTRITFTMPVLSNGTYIIYMTTPQGGAAILSPGIVYSGFPTWTISNYNATTTTINIQLLATGDAPLTFELQGGSTLPAGISLTSTGVLTGTTSVTADSAYNFTVIVTDAQLQNVQQLITLSFVYGDSYWKNTTLLLNGETTVTPFINDASANNFALTIVGDTKPALFNPYTPGYYSNYFDNNGDYLSIPYSTSISQTSPYTLEFWFYPTYNFNGQYIFAQNGGGAFGLNWTGTVMKVDKNGVGIQITGTTTLGLNQWHHYAMTYDGTTTRVFANGALDGSVAGTGGLANVPTTIGYYAALGNSSYGGYISNLRFVSGAALYTAAFTPSTTPLTAISGTSLLTCQSNRFIDTSTNAFTITENGDTIVSPNNPFTPNSSYSTYGSAYFDGTSDSLNLASAISLSGNFTIEAWVYPTAYPGTYHQIFNSSNFQFLIISDGTLWLWDTLSHQTTVQLNRWTYVSIIRSGTSVNLYVDGVKSTSTLTSSTTYVPQYIGSYGGSTEVFAGYISNFRVVTGTALYTESFTPPTSPLTVISGTSLLTLQYNGGANNSGIIDNGPFNNVLTRVGNTRQGSFSPYSVTGWSNYFNGSTDYLDVTTGIPVPLTGQFTFEAWVYTTKVNGGNSQTIYSQYSTSNANRWTINISTGNKLVVTHPSLTVTGATTFPVNQWVHIAITRDASNTLRIFLNGVVDATSASYTYSIFQDPPRIGYYKNTPNDYFTGYISNLRVVSGTALYTSAFTSPTAPFTAITNTTLLTCQSNRIVDNSPNNFAMTKTADVSVQAFSPFGGVPEAVSKSYSNYFDGTGGYLNITTNAALAITTGDFTIEGWYFYTGTVSDTRYLFDCRSGAEPSPRPLLYISSSTYNWYVNGSIVASGGTPVINTWTHFAVVKTAGSTKLYINGTVIFTYSDSQNYTSSFIRIGESWSGYISNFRFIKGTAVYTSTFTPSTTPLTAIANTSLLTCQNSTIIDNSTNRLTISTVIGGGISPKSFNPFGYTEQSKTSYTPTTHGGSIYLDGTGDYLSMVQLPIFALSGDYTIEAWIYKADSGIQRAIVDLRGGANLNILFYTLSGGQLAAFNSTSIFAQSTGTVPLNQWTHVAITRVGTSVRLFINGVIDGTATNSDVNVSSGSPLIGRQNGTTVNDWLGYISDVRIIKGTAAYTSNFLPPMQALTNYSTTYPSSLLLNFNNSGIIDQHSGVVLETLGNAQLSTAVKKYGNASMYFDGTGDYLTIPTNPGFVFGTGDFTIEAWFYIVSGAVGAIFDTRSGATGVTPLLFFSSSTLRYYVNGVDLITSGTTLSTATWYHVALVRNSGSSKMYLNGVQTGSTVVDVNNFTLTNTINIGRGNDNNNVLNGYIDDLRVTKGFARYTANFNAPTSAFLGQ